MHQIIERYLLEDRANGEELLLELHSVMTDRGLVAQEMCLVPLDRAEEAPLRATLTYLGREAVALTQQRGKRAALASHNDNGRDRA